MRRRASSYGRRAGRSSGGGRGAAALKVTMLTVMALVALAASSPVYASFAARLGSLPPPTAVAQGGLPGDTRIYDSTGKVLLADLHPPGYIHYQQSLKAMGRLLPEATIAVEDANFYREPGIDPLSIVRAALVDLEHHRIVEGGSTITQQLVKLRVVGSRETFTRKIKEALLSVQVARAYSKDQILKMYLNTIFYGNSSYGAEAAARNYFHTGAAQLDLAQASMLAGLPQNPSAYDPLNNWQDAKARQREVLNAMVDHHYVTKQEGNAAYAEDLRPPTHMFPAASADLVPGFTGYIASHLKAMYGSDALRKGLTVRTSLNWQLQQRAQEAITAGVRNVAYRNASDGAMVAIDPKTGAVLAMVGSAGPGVPGGQINMALTPRNPGSSFKIYTYSAAIASRRYTMVTPIHDVPIVVDMPGQTPHYAPTNDDGRYHGTCSLQQCLGNSLNVPAVQVELGTGLTTVLEEARAMGAPPYQCNAQGQRCTDNAPAGSFGPSLTLGGYPVTPLEMATGAATLADRGAYHRPIGILSVADAAGHPIYSARPAGKQVLAPGAAYILGQMLSNDLNRSMIFGTGTLLTLPGRTVAAKTGTTDNFTDGWTVGYNPDLAAAVWVGNANGAPMSTNSFGITVATPAWHQFMQQALDAMNAGSPWYQAPSGVQAIPAGGEIAYFLDGTSPSTPAPPLPSWVHLSPPPSAPGGNQGQGNGSGHGHGRGHHH